MSEKYLEEFGPHGWIKPVGCICCHPTHGRPDPKCPIHSHNSKQKGNS